MATTDPKRAALVRALMERDLYEMLDIPRDADDATITAAIATRTEWVEETPMRAAARDAEMHWLAWSERALITDPEIRADYDAALARKAAAVDRAVESRVRVRKLHAARDQLAKREAQRVVPIVIDPPKPAPAPRKRKAAVKKVEAGDSAHAVLQATQVTDVEEALRGLEGADGNVAVAIAFADRAGEIDDSAATLTRALDCVEWLLSPASDGITGRLLSAPWDPWPTLGDHRAALAASDVYTLRRIVPEDRGQKW